MKFEYVYEPIRLPAVLMVILAIVGLLIPIPQGYYESFGPSLIKLIVLAMAFGVFVWLLLQLALRAGSVSLYPDHIAIQYALRWRVQRIPYAVIRGYTRLSAGGLVIAHWYKGEQLFREWEDAPKKRLAVTPPVRYIDPLLAALAERFKIEGEAVPDAIMRRQVRARRIVYGIFFVFSIMVLPVLVITFSRFVYSFTKVF